MDELLHERALGSHLWQAGAEDDVAQDGQNVVHPPVGNITIRLLSLNITVW